MQRDPHVSPLTSRGASSSGSLASRALGMRSLSEGELQMEPLLMRELIVFGEGPAIVSHLDNHTVVELREASRLNLHNLGPEHKFPLVSLLRDNAVLRELYIESSNVFAAAVPHEGLVRSRDTSHNFNDSLVRALASLPSLEVLSFNKVPIYDKLLGQMFSSLASLTRLQKLTLMSTGCTKAISEELRNLCSTSLSITHMVLWERNLGDVDFTWVVASATGDMTTSVEYYTRQNAQLQQLSSVSKADGGGSSRKKLRSVVLCARRLEVVPAQLVNNAGMLKELDLSCNSLVTLPDELCKFCNLSVLNLNCNRLSVLPLSLLELTRLTVLLVAHNELVELSETIGFLSELHTLDVSCNHLRSLPLSIGCLTKLVKCEFQDPRNPSNAYSSFPTEMSSAAVLRTLRERLKVSRLLDRVPILVVGAARSGKSRVISVLANNGETPLTRGLKALSRSNSGRAPTKDRPPGVDSSPPLRRSRKESAGGERSRKESSSGGERSRKESFDAQRRSSMEGENKSSRDASEALSSDTTGGGDEEITTVEVTTISLASSSRLGADRGARVTLDAWEFCGTALLPIFDRPNSIVLLTVNLADFSHRSVVGLVHSMPSWQTMCILLVGTFTDKVPNAKMAAVESELARVRSDVPSIKDLVLISTKADAKHARRVLANMIQPALQRSSLLSRTYPESWHVLLNKLTLAGVARSPPVVPWSEIVRWALQCGVLETELEELSLLAKDAMRMVLSEPIKETSVAFLNPFWIASMWTPLMSLAPFLDHPGIVPVDEITQIWQPPQCPSWVTRPWMQLLKRHKVVVPVQPLRLAVVPTMLPRERKSALERWPTHCPDGVLQYSRTYTFASPVALSFVPSLMTTLLRAEWKFHAAWMTGFLIESAGELLLVEGSVSGVVLRVHLRSSVASVHLIGMLSTLASFISECVGHEPQVHVSCIHCIKAHSYDPFLFTRGELEDAVAKGIAVVYCRSINPVMLHSMAPDISMFGLAAHTLNFNDLQLGQLVGEGGFAKVYRGRMQGEAVAIKQLRPAGALHQGLSADEAAEKERRDMFAEFRREAWLMSGLVHTNLVCLRGICLEPFCIVMEYMNAGTLHALIHNKSIQGALPMRLVVRLALDIARGMEFLHGITPPIVHRDLKSPNILLHFSRRAGGLGGRLSMTEESLASADLDSLSSSSDGGKGKRELKVRTRQQSADKDDPRRSTKSSSEEASQRHRRRKSADERRRSADKDDWRKSPNKIDLIKSKDEIRKAEAALRVLKSSAERSDDDIVVQQQFGQETITLTAVPENVDDLTAKVADFGMSREAFMGAAFKSAQVENPTWAAPEMIRGETCTSKVDVYSFGVILWELVTRKVFFGSLRFLAEIEESVCRGKRPPIPSEVPQDLCRMIESSWAQEPAQRPTFQTLRLSLSRMGAAMGIDVQRGQTSHQLQRQVTKVDLVSGAAAAAAAAAASSHADANGISLLSNLFSAAQVLVPSHGSSVTAMALAGAHLWTGSSNGELFVWDLATGVLLHQDQQSKSLASTSVRRARSNSASSTEPTRNTRPAVSAVRSLNHTVWVGRQDGSLAVYGRDLKLLKQPKRHKDGVVFIGNEGSETVITVSMDGEVRRWNINTFKFTSLTLSIANIGCAVQMGVSLVVGTMSGGLIIVFPDGSLFQLLDAHSQAVHECLPVGDQLWTCSSDKLIKVWKLGADARSLECAGTLYGHSSRVFSLAADPLFELVFSGAWDKHILVWHAKELRFLGRLECLHTDGISCMEYWKPSNGPGFVVSGSMDRTVALYRHKTAAADDVPPMVPLVREKPTVLHMELLTEAERAYVQNLGESGSHTSSGRRVLGRRSSIWAGRPSVTPPTSSPPSGSSTPTSPRSRSGSFKAASKSRGSVLASSPGGSRFSRPRADSLSASPPTSSPSPSRLLRPRDDSPNKSVPGTEASSPSGGLFSRRSGSASPLPFIRRMSRVEDAPTPPEVKTRRRSSSEESLGAGAAASITPPPASPQHTPASSAETPQHYKAVPSVMVADRGSGRARSNTMDSYLRATAPSTSVANARPRVEQPLVPDPHVQPQRSTLSSIKTFFRKASVEDFARRPSGTNVPEPRLVITSDSATSVEEESSLSHRTLREDGSSSSYSHRGRHEDGSSSSHSHRTHQEDASSTSSSSHLPTAGKKPGSRIAGAGTGASPHALPTVQPIAIFAPSRAEAQSDSDE